MPERDASRRPDLNPGTVRDSLAGTKEEVAFRTIRWGDAVALRAEVGGRPSFVPFQGKGPNALGETRSFFEEWALGDQPDPSTLGLLRAIGGSMAAGFLSPLTSIVDEYQTSKIREMQGDFLKRNAVALEALDQHLGRAKAAMRQLGELGAAFPLQSTKLKDLLEKKRRFGDRTLSDLDAALSRTNDPEERKRLQAMRDDLAGWMPERDERVARENEEIGELLGRISAMEAEMLRQQSVFEKAPWSESPRTETSGTDEQGRPVVVSTTHSSPDAVVHAASLQDLLLDSKVGMDQALGD